VPVRQNGPHPQSRRAEEPLAAEAGDGSDKLGAVQLDDNVTVELALKIPDGKRVEGRLRDQMYYSLVDGRGMDLDIEVAGKIKLIELRPPRTRSASASARQGQRQAARAPRSSVFSWHFSARHRRPTSTARAFPPR
jgi:hypothetical protein